MVLEASILKKGVPILRKIEVFHNNGSQYSVKDTRRITSSS